MIKIITPGINEKECKSICNRCLCEFTFENPIDFENEICQKLKELIFFINCPYCGVKNYERDMWLQYYGTTTTTTTTT